MRLTLRRLHRIWDRWRTEEPRWAAALRGGRSAPLAPASVEAIVASWCFIFAAALWYGAIVPWYVMTVFATLFAAYLTLKVWGVPPFLTPQHRRPDTGVALFLWRLIGGTITAAGVLFQAYAWLRVAGWL